MCSSDLDTIGNAVGPHLASLKNKSPQVLLEAILDPNRAVEDKFVASTLVLEDGRSLVGLVQAESGNSITLVAADGRQHVVTRGQIESLATTGRSLMPEGFEKAISPDRMRDLLVFLLQAVTPAAERDGRFELVATEARLAGPKVGINRDAGCIAWMAEEDEAAWTLDLAEAGEFDVQIEWAQIDELDGNRFVLDSGAGELRGEFPSTHGWQTYSARSFGTISLDAGRSTLTLRPAGTVKTELADIRRVVLTRRRGS